MFLDGGKMEKNLCLEVFSLFSVPICIIWCELIKCEMLLSVCSNSQQHLVVQL